LDPRCCLAWFFFWYCASSISYGRLRPGTARLRPMLWDLQVRLRAQNPPLGSGTPHCLSTSTGPLGFAPFALGSSFFFFFAPGFSESPSILRFLPFFAPGSRPLIADFLARMSSSSSPFSFRSAASLASLASFFFRCLSAFLLRQSRMCVADAARRIGRRQCLHCIVSTLSSRGLPVWNPASVFSSRGFTTGEPAAAGLPSTSAIFQLLLFMLAALATVLRRTLCFALFPVASFRGFGRSFFDLESEFLIFDLDNILESAAAQDAGVRVHGACCCGGQSRIVWGSCGGQGPPFRAPFVAMMQRTAAGGCRVRSASVVT
jgi:hypothetical protein